MKDYTEYRKRGLAKFAVSRAVLKPKAKTNAYRMWCEGATFEEIALATGASIRAVKIEVARGVAKEFPDG